MGLASFNRARRLKAEAEQRAAEEAAALHEGKGTSAAGNKGGTPDGAEDAADSASAAPAKKTAQRKGRGAKGRSGA